MRRHPLLLAALVVLPSVGLEALPGRAETPQAPAPASEAAPAQAVQAPAPIPLAPEVKGSRPKSNPSVLAPAATELPDGLKDLAAPNSLSLPVMPSQVRIRELRPLGLTDVETLVEVNNPQLKALASQVEQAQSALRAQIAQWYPSISLNANNFPTYTGGQQFRTESTGLFGQTQGGATFTSIWQMQVTLQATWALIDPTRTPSVAAARDGFEKAKNQYLIGLRDLRLQAAEAFFTLQVADETVRIGQQSVRSSLVSLRDAKARFQAGVATKLEVLEAETQLARDQQVLTQGLADQAIARRDLASLLDLPQTVTPTSKEPSRVVGTWLPSLQESIVAAYAFREELDNILLDISIANSNANQALGEVQPFLNIAYNLVGGRARGFLSSTRTDPGFSYDDELVGDNTMGLNFRWNIFDGGRARALYRQNKQLAEQQTFEFANQRDTIRRDVVRSFYELERNNRNIITTSREVISTRESLRLARLRFQAGVATQREVVDTPTGPDPGRGALVHGDLRLQQGPGPAASPHRSGPDRGVRSTPTCRQPARSPILRRKSPSQPQPLVPACQAGSPSRPASMAPGS